MTLDNDSTPLPGRKSTGKRLRFEVFKRDYFTCRYCGAQPPDVVLVIDHIVAVVEGGPSTLDNLITACEPCNQGKAARSLGDASPRIDADERYLEAQQEIAEMRRYQRTLIELDRGRNELVETLCRRFAKISYISDYAEVKLAAAIRSMIQRYELAVIRDALDSVANRIASGRLTRSSDEFLPYLWGVCRNIARERGAD